ncbi:MAG: radical SAM protein [Dehalococcoidales bacterium]|nr:radical SAM protein [Dehalococcoidales bacterium]
MKVIRRSGTGFGWGINCYDGCEHGCLYCYGRRARWKKYEDWIKPVLRLQILSDINKDIQEIQQNPQMKNEIRDIMICSITDGYQPLELQHRITRNVIQILRNADLPFTLLTKNVNVLGDLSLFQGYNKCRVGFTIITLNDKFRRLLEPNTSPIKERCQALETLKKAGINTYCSIEPIISDKRSNPIAIVRRLKDYVDLFEFGKLNPKGKQELEYKTGISYNEGYYIKVFSDLIPFCEQEGISYCIASHSEKFLKSHGFRFIPYQLVTDIPYPKPTDGDYNRCAIL